MDSFSSRLYSGGYIIKYISYRSQDFPSLCCFYNGCGQEQRIFFSIWYLVMLENK